MDQQGDAAVHRAWMFASQASNCCPDFVRPHPGPLQRYLDLYEEIKSFVYFSLQSGACGAQQNAVLMAWL